MDSMTTAPRAGGASSDCAESGKFDLDHLCELTCQGFRSLPAVFICFGLCRPHVDSIFVDAGVVTPNGLLRCWERRFVVAIGERPAPHVRLALRG